MKKLLIASTIALAATAASALEVGVTATRDYAATNRNTAGITVGQKVGALGVTVGAERTTVGANDQNRYTVVAGYDLVKLGTVTVTPKVGGAYVANQTGADGYALVAGVGASYPITKTIAATVDYARQIGQDRIESANGNRFTAGVKYNF
jgi:opacity protein-like surface antigen